MKILLTGGATGGHFYPLIAVAEEIREVARERKLLSPKLYFMSNTPYNPSILFDNDITYVYAGAGKIRRNMGPLNLIKNFFDLFATFFGIVKATITMFSIYPDVVFGKGGYASFPALFAAKLLRIPVVIHDSDSQPGMVTTWAGKFAERVALSYPDAADYFPIAKKKNRIAWTGNPIRREIITPITSGAHEFLNLEENTPVILVYCGSQGSQFINDAILRALPKLVEKFQIIHTTGKLNYKEVKGEADVILEGNLKSGRYKAFDYLNALSLRMSVGVSNLVIARAGSSIFEIAAWGLPSIIVPIPESVSHDQKHNAFNYARTGAAVVIEQNNLTPEILISECERIIENKEKTQKMSDAARKFAKLDAGKKVAEAIIEIALKHESKD